MPWWRCTNTAIAGYIPRPRELWELFSDRVEEKHRYQLNKIYKIQCKLSAVRRSMWQNSWAHVSYPWTLTRSHFFNHWGHPPKYVWNMSGKNNSPPTRFSWINNPMSCAKVHPLWAKPSASHPWCLRSCNLWMSHLLVKQTCSMSLYQRESTGYCRILTINKYEPAFVGLWPVCASIARTSGKRIPSGVSWWSFWYMLCLCQILIWTHGKTRSKNHSHIFSLPNSLTGWFPRSRSSSSQWSQTWATEDSSGWFGIWRRNKPSH